MKRVRAVSEVTMDLYNLNVWRMLLVALVVSAIPLTSCVDVPVPAVCEDDAFTEVGTHVFLELECNGPEPLVEFEAKLANHDINVDTASAYVEAICTWNQNELSRAEINWGSITTTKGFSATVENVAGGSANCTFAGCYVANNKGYSLESQSCEYDRDECYLGEDNCHENATCNNTHDGFECHCHPMFTGNGINCTEIPLPTTTPSFLPTTTPNILPTTTPEVPTEDMPTPFRSEFLSLLVLVLMVLMTSAAVLALTIWRHLRRKHRRVTFPGKIDPDCMLVNPKTIVYRLSITSLSSELHELSFDTTDGGNQWEDERQIQQLSFRLKSTNSSSEEGGDEIHCCSLPNVQDGLKMAAAPTNDTLEPPETQIVSELCFNPMTTKDESSPLQAESTVDWCIEDRVSDTNDSNSHLGTTEYCTSLGPTHQSNSQTQPQTFDNPYVYQPMVATIDSASPTGSTELDCPVFETITELSLAGSATCEQLDDELDEEESNEQDGDIVPSTSVLSRQISRHDTGLDLEEEGDYIITIDLPNVTNANVTYSGEHYIKTGTEEPNSDIYQQHQGITFGTTMDNSDLEIDLTQYSQTLPYQVVTC